jgi:nucleoside-diphosphate-sugar epimerase
MLGGMIRGPQRLWIAGGRGFIGRRVVAMARAQGVDVAVFEGDVRDAGAVESSLADARADVVMNLAAPVDVRRDPALIPTMDAVIVGGALNVYRAAGRATLLQCGTCEEYGTIEAPFAEDDTPSDPVSPYAAAKLAATRALLALHRERPDGPRVVVARPFLTYGPGQRTRALIPAAIGAALAGVPFPTTEGLQTRELNHVDDVARGLLLAATTPAAHGRVVNLAGGEERRVIDVVRLVFELCGADPALIQAGALPTREGEVPRFCGDPRLAQALLGYRPEIPLRAGLRQTIDAARAAA